MYCIFCGSKNIDANIPNLIRCKDCKKEFLYMTLDEFKKYLGDLSKYLKQKKKVNVEEKDGHKIYKVELEENMSTGENIR